MARAGKAVVYQEATVLPEQQAVLDEAFTIVGPREAAGRALEVAAIFCSPGDPDITAELLDRFPNVRAVSTHSTGYERVDMAACKSRGVRVGTVGGVLSATSADMAMALLLASARGVVEWNSLSRDPNLTALNYNAMKGVEVWGGVLGIVGMGRIGLEVAKRARARGFDMTVLYHNRHQRPREVEESVCATYSPSLHELLSRADFVVVTVPGTAENRHMFDTNEFSAMKSTTVFVNIGRGSLVNHDSLAVALQRGEIGSVALDVTEPEPLPRDHPLLSLDNVIITPHRASATMKCRMKMIHTAVENIQTALQGETMPSEVT